MRSQKITLRLAIFLLALIGFSTSAASLTGQTAPDFKLDEQLKLSSLRGKVVYLDFWASWCGPCRKSFPWMNKLSKQYSDADLVVLSVNLDSDISLAQKFLKQYPAEFSVVFDAEGKIAEQYQVMGMPSSYVIDRQGKVAAVHIGFFNNKVASYEQSIARLVKQK